MTLTDDPAQTDIVVACFDRTFDYRKLQQAFDAIRAGARFIATNRDPYCPVPGGGLPACGALAAVARADGAAGFRASVAPQDPSRRSARMKAVSRASASSYAATWRACSAVA